MIRYCLELMQSPRATSRERARRDDQGRQISRRDEPARAWKAKCPYIAHWT